MGDYIGSINERDQAVVTRIRIYEEEPGQWAMDGANGFDYTELIWNFKTHTACVANLTRFIKELAKLYKLNFDPERTERRLYARPGDSDYVPPVPIREAS